MPTLTLTTRRPGHAPVECCVTVPWQGSRFRTAIAARTWARRLLVRHEAPVLVRDGLPESIAAAVLQDAESYTARVRRGTYALTWDATDCQEDVSK